MPKLEPLASMEINSTDDIREIAERIREHHSSLAKDISEFRHRLILRVEKSARAEGMDEGDLRRIVQQLMTSLGKVSETDLEAARLAVAFAREFEAGYVDEVRRLQARRRRARSSVKVN